MNASKKKDNKAERKESSPKNKKHNNNQRSSAAWFPLSSHLSLASRSRFAPNFLLPAAAFAALTKVCLDLLPLLLAFDDKLDPESQVV
jgi:hypothetical protein